MFFQKRLERAREVQRHLSGLDREDEERESVGEADAALGEADATLGEAQGSQDTEENAKGKRRKRRFFRFKEIEEDDSLKKEMEKGDLPAMMLAGFLTLFLPAVAVLALLVLIVYLIFGLF